jgi:hypothetical protein
MAEGDEPAGHDHIESGGDQNIQKDPDENMQVIFVADQNREETGDQNNNNNRGKFF